MDCERVFSRDVRVTPLIVWLILCGIWGSTWLFIKLGLQDLPPMTFAGLRFVIAFLILAVIILARRLPWPRKSSDWQIIAVTGFLTFTVDYGLLFWGELHVSSGLAAILQAATPLFGLVLAHQLLPSEPMTPSKIAGVLIGMIGVAVIFADQVSDQGSLAVWGSTAIVVGAFAVALSNVIIKAKGSHFDPAVISAGQMLFGLVPLLVLGFLREGNPLHFRWTKLALISLLYLAVVGSALAFMLYYWLVRHMDVTNTMLISLITPIVAVLLGMGAAGEHLTLRMVVGGSGIVTGIGIIGLWRPRG
jgi:drug/metabolite transporter (DMT)-like permease